MKSLQYLGLFPSQQKISFFNNKKALLILCFIIYAFGWSPQTGMTGDVSSIPGYRILYKSGKMLFYQIKIKGN